MASAVNGEGCLVGVGTLGFSCDDAVGPNLYSGESTRAPVNQRWQEAVVEKPSEEILTQEEDEAGDDSIKIVIHQMDAKDEDEVGEEEMMDLGAKAHTPEFLDYDEPSEVEVEVEKQEELERLNNRNEKLRVKLREVKVHYNMARGAIISINRKWSQAEAELRKKDAEMERVQKELKDRCNQLHDMSNKLVAELQSGQMVNNEEIVKLKTEINKLQLHITAEDVRKRHLQAEFDKAIFQGEVMQRDLQDLQIALKFTGTRLERFISKIVQAVYTAPGIVQPTTQITDEDTLEMFQTILDDRLTFHRMLTESGIPVPPLFGTIFNPETSCLSSKQCLLNPVPDPANF
ncbi:hypothetical protein chiPu_0013556 [Chiloscyllium punctatum]|uniref:Uncharacterized protein n=1 Tax=Chiloscyllium punctatum TaxID=137246 RepID=A0A401SXM4_CHIPU|nr:hypothetical protein [Chiloscyllium punctatum]